MTTTTLQQEFETAVRHHQAGRLAEAEVFYRQVLRREPAHAGALHYLGLIAHQVGQNDLAIDLIRQAIARRPDYHEAYNNLGIALMRSGKLDEAVAAYRQSIAIKADFPQAHGNLGVALTEMGELDEAIAACRRAISLQPSLAAAHGNLLYAIHFHPGYDGRTIADEHRRWSQQHAEPLRHFIQPHVNDRNPDRRLRIGYVSVDFRDHVVGKFLLPLLANHDKREVEVFAYAQVPVPDAMTERLRACCDHWQSIVGISDVQVADLIRRDRIDILVDLTAHMADSRILVFAHKPAPVQATYLAYCSTTGLNTIDYRLSDPWLDPPGADESIYTEQTLRLPETYWCYQQHIPLPDAGPLPALAKGEITFGCLNNFCKVSERVFVAWARILRAVPGSRLLLHAHAGAHRRRVLDLLEREGIAPDRVQFAAKVPTPQYFALYHQIDIALDTFPYAGGTTTCDALWMGVPVVSLRGDLAVGRGGYSILSNVGLPEWVARSEEDYVRIATESAGDIPRLSALRLRLRGRMEQSPLMDAPRFARAVEAAYRTMWRRWLA